MSSIKDTSFYHDCIHILSYPFGDFYLFDTFVIGEVNEGVVIKWKDHAQILVADLENLYEQNTKNLVYISNRVNPYSVVPSDWVHFFRYGYAIKGYGIISYNLREKLNSKLENLFFKKAFKSLDSLSDAILWARELNNFPRIPA